MPRKMHEHRLLVLMEVSLSLGSPSWRERPVRWALLPVIAHVTVKSSRPTGKGNRSRSITCERVGART